MKQGGDSFAFPGLTHVRIQLSISARFRIETERWQSLNESYLLVDRKLDYDDAFALKRKMPRKLPTISNETWMFPNLTKLILVYLDRLAKDRCNQQRFLSIESELLLTLWAVTCSKEIDRL